MLVIPAIDLSGGRVVRLKQGRFDRKTEFSDDPLAVVEKWVAAGAQRLHMVDLDGARTGLPAHRTIVERTLRRWPELAVQLGGGIRNMETLAGWMDAGVRFPVLGTAAIADAAFAARAAERWPQQVVLALDAHDGQVATHGWEKSSGEPLLKVAARYSDMPLATILHTDIGRDGMMTGPNIAASEQLARAQPHPVLVSGGVRNLEDLEAIMASGVLAGAICGRALYEGELDLAAALRLSAAAVGPSEEGS